MNIIVDTCVISAVFNTENSQHTEFKPVLTYIDNKRAVMVYGGTKYKRELKLMPRYFKIIKLLQEQNKVKEISDRQVNEEENKISEFINGKAKYNGFNDKHIVALAIVSRSKIICSTNSYDFQFFKDGDFYPHGMIKPKIYSSHNHNHLFEDF